jgi:DNA-binding MarR family transcriptional regulator
MSSRSKSSSLVEPVECLATIFSARKDLLKPIRKAVLKDVPLTLDEADTLTMLYGIHKLAWTDAPVDRDGFVTVSDLRSALVHDPGKLSRRIKDFQKRRLIEIKKSPDRRTYVDAVKISEAGVEIAKLVWNRYRKLAEHLLANVSQEDRAIHCRVNMEISKAVEEFDQPILSTLLD